MPGKKLGSGSAQDFVEPRDPMCLEGVCVSDHTFNHLTSIKLRVNKPITRENQRIMPHMQSSHQHQTQGQHAHQTREPKDQTINSVITSASTFQDVWEPTAVLRGGLCSLMYAGGKTVLSSRNWSLPKALDHKDSRLTRNIAPKRLWKKTPTTDRICRPSGLRPALTRPAQSIMD